MFGDKGLGLGQSSNWMAGRHAERSGFLEGLEAPSFAPDARNQDLSAFSSLGRNRDPSPSGPQGCHQL